MKRCFANYTYWPMSIEEKVRGPETDSTFNDQRGKLENALSPVAKHLPHPNIITCRIRPALAAIGLALQPISPVAASCFYGANSLCDWFDGMSARVNNQRTAEGERMDPFVDKVINASYLAYLAIMEAETLAFQIASGVAVAADAYGQSVGDRGPLIEQGKEYCRVTKNPHGCKIVEGGKVSSAMANLSGKVKMALQSVAILAMMLGGDNEAIEYASTVSLSIASVLGGIGIAQRMSVKKVLSESEK